MVRIAVDTACDKGFETVLEGAERALERDGDLEIVLVAGEDRPFRSCGLGGVELVMASRTYSADMPKSEQLESSIYKAIEMHKRGEVDAVLSPGDTRGVVVYADKILGLMKGVSSPAIATHWINTNVLIDSGANVTENVTTKDMLHFAIMGKVFSQEYIGIKTPQIGLVNVGTEKSKGPKFVRRSRRLIDKLDKAGYNISDKYFEPYIFVDIDGGEYGGRVGVIPGFSGNIGLKFAEAPIRFFHKYLPAKIREKTRFERICAYIGLYRTMKEIKRDLNYKSHSAAPLMGVNGNVIITHGGADAEIIVSSIETARKYVERGVNEKLKEEIAKYGKV